MTDQDDGEDSSEASGYSVWIDGYDKVRLKAVSARVMRERFLKTNSARDVTPGQAITALLDEAEAHAKTIKRLETTVEHLEQENQELKRSLADGRDATSAGLFDDFLDGHQPGPTTDPEPSRRRGHRGARLL